MANVDRSFGFRYMKSRGGRIAEAQKYYIPSGDSTAVFIGSPVKLAGGADGNGISTVALAADSDKPCGVVVGVDQVDGVADANFSLYRKHRVASVGMYVFVIDDPEALFEIQADDAAATLAAADMGLNCGFTAESGDTVSGLSTIELDTSDKATTSTLPLRIERLVQRPGNNLGEVNQNVVVSFNIHAFKTGYDTGATAEIGGLGV